MSESFDPRASWAHASQLHTAATVALAAACSELPMAPADGICTECGGSSWELQESGYVGAWPVQFLPGDAIDPLLEPASLYLVHNDAFEMSVDGTNDLVLVCTNYLPSAVGVDLDDYCGLAYRRPLSGQYVYIA